MKSVGRFRPRYAFRMTHFARIYGFLKFCRPIPPLMRKTKLTSTGQLIENKRESERQINCYINSASDVPLDWLIPANIENSRPGKSTRQ